MIFKINYFFLIFCTILKSISIFEHFEEEDDPHGLCILEITECKISA